MSNVSNRVVLFPSYINLTKEGLRSKDLLVYLTIRSFNNSKQELCIPSISTIAEKAGLSRPYVIDAIKRLEAAEHLIVSKTSDKPRASNKYEFKKLIAYSQIPYSIFDAEDLSPTEKATLIMLRQSFHSYSSEMMGNLKDAAELLDISYRALYKQYSSLVEKGYIEKFEEKRRNGYIRKGIRLTNKLVWPVPPIESLVNNVKADISSIADLLIG